MTDQLLGHSIQRERLSHLWKEQRLSPSLLFVGKEGIGKKLVALELARTLICSSEGTTYGGCQNCHECTLMTSGNHPDIFLIDGKEKEESNAEAIRGLLQSLHLKSFHDTPRLVILDNADFLNNTAANILLKELEEPGQDIFFILVCTNPSRLPETICSRCQKWYFHRLDDPTLAAILKSNKELIMLIEESDFDVRSLLEVADGSISTAREFIGLKSRWIEIQKQLQSIKKGNPGLVLALAEEIKAKKELIPAQLSLLRMAGKKFMKEAEHDAEQQTWAIFVQNIIQAEILITERYLSPSYVLTCVFLQLLPEKMRSGLEALPNSGTLLDDIIGL